MGRCLYILDDVVPYDDLIDTVELGDIFGRDVDEYELPIKPFLSQSWDKLLINSFGWSTFVFQLNSGRRSAFMSNITLASALGRFGLRSNKIENLLRIP